MKDSLSFLTEFSKHPGKIGAVLPSSEALAKEMMVQAKVSEKKNVVEFGAGTGVFTRHILQLLPSDGIFISIEQNPRMVQMLCAELNAQAQSMTAAQRLRFQNPPIYCDTAENLPTIMKAQRMEHVDTIISGLPWAAFSDELQDRLLTVAYDSLRPGGYFSTFAYLQGVVLPAGKLFKRKICARFAEVKKSPIVWGNFPPAFIYRCRKAD